MEERERREWEEVLCVCFYVKKASEEMGSSETETSRSARIW